jgi:hypothetical protein
MRICGPSNNNINVYNASTVTVLFHANTKFMSIGHFRWAKLSTAEEASVLESPAR